MANSESDNKQPWLVPIVVAALSTVGVLGTAWLNRPQLQPSPSASPSPRASVVATVSTPERTASTLRKKAVQITPATSGNLEHTERQVNLRTLDLNQRNFIVEATFYNPSDGAVAPWSYGFVLRKSKTNAKTDTFDLAVQSNDKSYNLRYVNQNVRSLQSAGPIPNLDTSARGLNKLTVFVNDKKALFFVNDRYIRTLNVSALTNSGDIGVAANFNFEGVKGKTTRYEKLVVYSLDEVQ